METILTNKRFIRVVIIFMVLLSLFTLAKFINEVKSSEYVGRGNQQPNVISVSGKGEVMAVSDIATLTMNLTKDGVTSKEAQKNLNDMITKVLATLKDKKIEDKDVKSEYGGINPKYSNQNLVCYTYPCPQNNPKIIGYTATQSLTVKIRDVDTANDIRTSLATVGVTDINGPTFSIDDEDTFKDQARSSAIKDARTQAEVLAKELGVHLGKVVTFSENGGSAYPMMYDSKAMMAGTSAMPSAPELPKGQNKITSNVTITYEIR